MDILAFCQKREIATEGMKISQVVDWNKKKHDQSRVVLQIELPPHFPEKYDNALGKTVDKCLVASLGRGLDESSFDKVVTRRD